MLPWHYDPRQLFFAASVIDLMFALAIGVIALVDNRTRGMRWFSAASFMLVLQMSFRIWHARDESALWDVRISAWALFSYALMAVGLYWFCERRAVYRARLKMLVLLALCIIALLIPKAAAFPLFVVLRGATCMLMVSCLAMMWRPRLRALRAATRPAAAIMAVLAFLLLLFPIIKAFALTRNSLWMLEAIRSVYVLFCVCLQLNFVALYVLEMKNRLQEETRMDVLTGLQNRRAFEEQAQVAVDHAVSRDQSLALLMIDLDDFKVLNDRWGHSCGDQALSMVGAVLNGALADPKSASRIGGEEFAVLLEGFPLAEARQMAEDIRDLIEAIHLQSGSDRIAVTASIGVSVLLPGEVVWHDLLQRADKALYGAKSQGRNCVAVSANTSAPLPHTRETSAWERIFRGGMSL